MGLFLKQRGSAAATVAILATAAAVAVPCALWYVIGSRQLERVVGELRQGAQREAVTTAMQLAAKVSLQLDDLMRGESERSPLEYFPVYRWRGARCGKVRARRSPLAHGDYPHAVKFYFQIDADGRVGGPRAGVDLAALEVPLRGRVGRLQPMPGFDPLRSTGPASPAPRASVVPSGVRPWHLARFEPPGGQGEGPGLTARAAAGLSATTAQSVAAVASLDIDALSGETLFPSDDDPGLPSSDEPADVGPFRWVTGRWRGEPLLLAVRNVSLRDRPLVQGFAVETRALSDWMFGGGFPARLQPGPARIQSAAMLPTGGIDWHVAFDPGPALEGVRRQEATLRGQFRTSYLGGLLAAMLAGACVVALVLRSGRLARERARFAAAAAHELRTPLAGIRLHGEMLAASLGNPASIQRYAQRITDEAERLSRVVANVLSHSRGEHQRLTVTLAEGDLAAAVQACLHTMEPLLQESGAVLVAALDPALPPLRFDADAIHQILRNLIDNAEKYSRRARDRRIEVTLRPGPAGGARLSVADHGPGVAPALRGRLFRPFVNADTEAKHAGLGLGLSVVAALVAAHGGKVALEDTPGGGATFVVDLP